jgi:hypothetical protein
MTSAGGRLTRWIDAVERLTLVQVGQPSQRWSWFQVAWTGLHAAALMMHVLSVLYHARRVVCTEADEPLFVAGCPARHASEPVRPLLLTDRLIGARAEERTAAS